MSGQSRSVTARIKRAEPSCVSMSTLVLALTRQRGKSKTNPSSRFCETKDGELIMVPARVTAVKASRSQGAKISTILTSFGTS